jgi:hypothetical protein
MQFELQFVPGSTVTVKELVATLPHLSVAEAMTVLVELTGKQVPLGGLNVRASGSEQQWSMAKTLYGTAAQLLQV